MSLITSPAISKPATEGTKEMLPGIGFPLSPKTPFLMGSSLEYKTFKCLIPLAFNSLLMTLARGQT